MSKRDRPPVGSVLYDVHEHLYYIPDHAGPVKEYVVAAGEVTGFFEGGYVEVCLCGRVADRIIPRRRKLSEIGKTVFYTAREAANYAKDLTDKYERTWSGISNDPPMRRTWEHFLTEDV